MRDLLTNIFFSDSSGMFLLMKTLVSKSILAKYYFLHPFFINPHRKDISHEHNADAPRERNPDVVTDRLI